MGSAGGEGSARRDVRVSGSTMAGCGTALDFDTAAALARMSTSDGACGLGPGPVAATVGPVAAVAAVVAGVGGVAGAAVVAVPTGADAVSARTRLLSPVRRISTQTSLPPRAATTLKRSFGYSGFSGNTHCVTPTSFRIWRD